MTTSPTSPEAHTPGGDGVPEPHWHWRNCRSFGFKLDLWLWPWIVGMHIDEDVYGGERWLYIGPLALGIAYSIGNSSADGMERFTGLSGAEAYDRALRYERNAT